MHPPGHLESHPLPPGIVGALGLHGYGLLVDLGGVGAGRLGPQAFLLVAPDPHPDLPDAGTQIALHTARLRDERELAAYTQLAAQLGALRMGGYRLALERAGLRSKVSVVDPATGAIVAVIPDRQAGGLFARRSGIPALLAVLRALPPAGPPPDTRDLEGVRGLLVALALRDDGLSGAEVAELADRALALVAADPTLDPPAALIAARSEA